LTLYDGHSLSWIALGAGLIGLPVFMLVGMSSMVRTRCSTSAIGRAWLIGEEGEATTRLAPAGTVRIRRRRWKARTDRDGGIDADRGIRVVEVDGLLLEVEPV